MYHSFSNCGSWHHMRAWTWRWKDPKTKTTATTNQTCNQHQTFPSKGTELRSSDKCLISAKPALWPLKPKFEQQFWITLSIYSRSLSRDTVMIGSSNVCVCDRFCLKFVPGLLHSEDSNVLTVPAVPVLTDLCEHCSPTLPSFFLSSSFLNFQGLEEIVLWRESQKSLNSSEM